MVPNTALLLGTGSQAGIQHALGLGLVPGEDFGFHLALYYSYSTNKSSEYDMHGINNLGFKLGIAF